MALLRDVLDLVAAGLDHLARDGLEETRGLGVGSAIGQVGVEPTLDAERVVAPIAGGELRDGLQHNREADAVASDRVCH